MKKYILRPGEITSRYDGDTHYISARELARLYEVDLKECYIDRTGGAPKSAYPEGETLINLHPKWNGNYKKEGE